MALKYIFNMTFPERRKKKKYLVPDGTQWAWWSDDINMTDTISGVQRHWSTAFPENLPQNIYQFGQDLPLQPYKRQRLILPDPEIIDETIYPEVIDVTDGFNIGNTSAFRSSKRRRQVTPDYTKLDTTPISTSTSTSTSTYDPIKCCAAQAPWDQKIQDYQTQLDALREQVQQTRALKNNEISCIKPISKKKTRKKACACC
jgi:hypothetical protein